MMKNPAQQSTKITSFLGFLMAQPYLLLVLAPVFWGGNVVAAKLAVGEISPQFMLMGRWLGASLVVLPFAWPHVKRDWPKIKKSWWLFALYGVFGYACFNILMYSSAYYTTGVNISIEQGSIPVLVLFANFLFFGVRAKPLQIVGLLLTLLGVIWVATYGEPQRLLALNINIGDGMVLLACVLYAGYSLLLRYRPDVHWLSFIFFAAIAALATALVFQFTTGGNMQQTIASFKATTFVGWMVVVYIMIFPSILSQLFYARGVEIIGANRASIFINLLPIMGTILTIIILGEKFETYHLIASFLVLVGIMLSEYAARVRL